MINQKYFDFTNPFPEFSVKVSTIINYSENEMKVNKAVQSIFPLMEFEIKDNLIVGINKEIKTLKKFCNLIYNQKILDAARNYLLSQNFSNNEPNIHSSNLTICINKQIAFYEKISLSSEGESPLGPIEIEITVNSSDIERFIDMFFPKYEWIIEESFDHVFQE